MTLQQQIYLHYRSLITQGRLKADARLPSIRALANELGVAKGTVEAVYDRLIGEGLLVSRGAAGTYVASAASPVSEGAPIVVSGDEDLPVLEAAGAGLGGDGGWPLSFRSAPLAIGVPALDQFPRKTWTRLTTRQVRTGADMLLPDPRGLLRLRQALASHVQGQYGLVCRPEQVYVVPGHLGALTLIMRALLEPGDQVWVESPGSPSTSQGLRSLGLLPVPVPVDASGLMVTAARKLASEARMAIVTPASQSPLGMRMANDRRRQLLAWARRSGAVIFENNYEGEFALPGLALQILASGDRAGDVIYGGSLSQILYPGLRLSYLVVPPAHVPRFDVVSNWATAIGSAGLMQAVVADFFDSGGLGRHIKRMRTIYSRRRKWLARSIDEVDDPRFRVALPGGGLRLQVKVVPNLSDVELAEAAASAGFPLHALSRCSVGRVGERNGLLLGFTNLASLDEARQQVNALRRAWRNAGLLPSARR